MMFENTDADYLRKRVSQERERAATAANTSARAAHNMLAREYERRLSETDSAGRPVVIAD